jgi:hypothetical protein
MRNVNLVCSLLVAFSVSMLGLGCDSSKPAPKMTGPAPTMGDSEAVDGTKATGSAPKDSGAGSTTGGGIEVPADPAGGTTEEPATVPEVKAPDATPDAKPEETSEAKPEEKTEESTEDK